MEKYLIVGTGGVGGSIAGFLALAGKDVTCIARGKHLEAIREKGLHLRSDLKGNHFLPIQACTAEEYNEKANVIFVCVKGYSLDSIKDLLEKASDKDTLIIPILNVYGIRSPHRATRSTCNSIGRMHLHRRFRFRTG